MPQRNNIKHNSRDFLMCAFSLPKVIKNRIHALKNLQVESAKIEAKFYEEVHELERKYSASYQPLFDKVSAAQIKLQSDVVKVEAAVAHGQAILKLCGFKSFQCHVKGFVRIVEPSNN